MAVLPYSNTSCIHGVAGRTSGNTTTSTTSTTTSTIQPSVNTILDLARECDQHVVRLYFLPTPGTNGFTTTHTLVRNDTRTHPAATHNSNSPYDIATATTTTAGSGHQVDTNGDTRDAHAKYQRRRRICHLTRVSESDRGIVHLARLHISSMIVATSSITYLSHLVSLRLQGNRLTDLPDQIFRLPSLRELDVSQNRLTEISGLIGMLGLTLEELFLQSNQLQSLPQQLGRLTRLRLLDIADNQLGCIPVEVQRLVSESLMSERMLRRASQGGIDSRGEGSSAPPTPLDSPVALHGQGGAGHFNAGSNEEGGHDDDDYVQIRQGMKCWARGNRFWQVGAPRFTAPQSPSGTVPSQGGPSWATSATRPAEAVLTPPTAFLNAGASFSALPFQPLGPSLLSPSPPLPATPIRANSGHLDSTPTSPTYHNQNNTHNHSHRSHNHSHQETSHYPAHPVDQRGYSKDSYTSCSWTLSLADICSQIVGEKLNQDPHYFCHTRSCPHKAARKSNRKAGPPTSPPGTLLPSTTTTTTTHNTDPLVAAAAYSEMDKMGECMATMIPEWMIEQLGLHRLAEMRRALDLFNSEDEQQSHLDEWDGHEDIYPDSYQDRDTEAGVQGSSQNSLSGLPLLHRRGRRRSLKDPTISMSLTLVEKEMGCEFCSVCQKRLYFPGLRWKGVGVMDERIVPLEWVACSVQCRAQAEGEEQRRKASGGKASAMASMTSTMTSTPTTSTLGVTPITEEEDPSGGDSGGEGYFGGRHHQPQTTTFNWSPRPEGSQAIASTTTTTTTATTTMTTRARSGTHHHDSPPSSSSSHAAATSLVGMTSRIGGLVAGRGIRGQVENGSGLSSIIVDQSRSREISMVQQQQQQQCIQLQQQQQLQLQQQQHHLQQRNYRETIAYGLIKSKALRRRTRALSL
ncbi:hypothetical protein KI688_010208 [Linnemannia hyalina]|uniref:L domain-like protein n=1 Tax=Linnemannia hyalina TaxID=64524 RepID=A0A9P8BUF6_9FUNG|nr:hypothetical protein KI688_010208 [Linnemannia hyalina]